MNVLRPCVIYPELHAALGWGFWWAFHDLFPGVQAWIALGILELVLLLKESIFDPRFETDNPFFWQGMQDLAWYQVGIGAAITVVVLHGWG